MSAVWFPCSVKHAWFSKKFSKTSGEHHGNTAGLEAAAAAAAVGGFMSLRISISSYPDMRQPISSRFRSRFAPTSTSSVNKAACMFALSKLGRLRLEAAAQSVRFAFTSPNRAPSRSTGAPMMEQMGMADAQRGRAVRRPRRAAGKLAVVVAVQNVLVVVCVLVTVYVYWDAQKKTSSEDIPHIQFDPISVNTNNGTLRFSHATSRNSIDFDENTDKMYIKCTGPYILHMFVCYKSRKEDYVKETPLIVQLQVENNPTPAGTMELQPSRPVCRWLHSIVYLKAKDVASLHLNSTTLYSIKSVTVGLNSLQGKRCVKY